MFQPLDILLEYWIEHVTIGLIYVMFTFPTRILYRGVVLVAFGAEYLALASGMLVQVLDI